MTMKGRRDWERLTAAADDELEAAGLMTGRRLRMLIAGNATIGKAITDAAARPKAKTAVKNEKRN